jgi:hypothetical protein
LKEISDLLPTTKEQESLIKKENSTLLFQLSFIQE